VGHRVSEFGEQRVAFFMGLLQLFTESTHGDIG
jgi:hypothetical protein